MNNIRKIALGLTVATFALGFSAFKSAGKLVSATYYQTSNNLYVKITGATGNCNGSNTTTPCSIFYATDPNVAPFAYEDRPTGGSDTAVKKIYNP